MVVISTPHNEVLTFIDQMKKHLILIVTIVILAILLIAFIPSVAKGMRITKLQNQLKDYQMEYTKCEAVLLNSHSWAEAVRAKLNEELGNSFTNGTLYMPTTGATQLLDQYLSGTSIE